MPAVAMPGIARRHASDPIVGLPFAGVTQCLKKIQGGSVANARETRAWQARGKSRRAIENPSAFLTLLGKLIPRALVRGARERAGWIRSGSGFILPVLLGRPTCNNGMPGSTARR